MDGDVGILPESVVNDELTEQHQGEESENELDVNCFKFLQQLNLQQLEMESEWVFVGFCKLDSIFLFKNVAGFSQLQWVLGCKERMLHKLSPFGKI